MLGVTAGRGNSVSEIVRGLESSAAADGTKPPGTIYFVSNDDVRSKTRSPAFPPIVKAIEALGVRAEVVSGVLPSARRDVAGLMTGTAEFDWAASKSTILPGAICDNLTSYGGIFTATVGQTPLSAFIRAGAAGSSGTVIEPYALQPKFPHPAIQLHYARAPRWPRPSISRCNHPINSSWWATRSVVPGRRFRRCRSAWRAAAGSRPMAPSRGRLNCATGHRGRARATARRCSSHERDRSLHALRRRRASWLSAARVTACRWTGRSWRTGIMNCESWPLSRRRYSRRAAG